MHHISLKLRVVFSKQKEKKAKYNSTEVKTVKRICFCTVGYKIKRDEVKHMVAFGYISFIEICRVVALYRLHS